MRMLHEIPIQVWPTSLTAFVHEIALHGLLSTKLWNLLPIFVHETGLDRRHKAKGVAGSTLFLIFDRRCKIKATLLSKIKIIWQVSFRDILSLFVLLSHRLNAFEYSRKLFIIHVAEVLLLFTHDLSEIGLFFLLGTARKVS
jgi:hypothetical protein